ncbi:MAG TPA: cyclic nucleotide-binding domain-containing protein [Ramlibacter sp.]|nr:cyclic nucleotide-binding domain-containing protein [Ramlibacter sp.]
MTFFKPSKADIARLMDAVAGNRADDTLGRFMKPEAWDILALYLSQEKIERGHVLIAQGALDRTLYFVESGVLRVHFAARNGDLQLALIGPGSVVGEGSFFSEIARNATVQATQTCVLWALTPERFAQMSKKDPVTALALSMALGAVLSTRMLDVSRKISVT